jgi:hypothetical protein
VLSTPYSVLLLSPSPLPLHPERNRPITGTAFLSQRDCTRTTSCQHTYPRRCHHHPHPHRLNVIRSSLLIHTHSCSPASINRSEKQQHSSITAPELHPNGHPPNSIKPDDAKQLRISRHAGPQPNEEEQAVNGGPEATTSHRAEQSSTRGSRARAYPCVPGREEVCLLGLGPPTTVRSASLTCPQHHCLHQHHTRLHGSLRLGPNRQEG